MKGSETNLLSFMEGADKRFIIPVYQRKYDWNYANCRKVYDDLKRVISMRRKTHFFGNIVSQIIPDGSKIEYHIIDGQQRLTTISLLLLAMKNLVEKGFLKSEENGLGEQIAHRFLISPWAKSDDRIKLRPVKNDRDALNKLFDPVAEPDPASNLTINYQLFHELLLKEEVPVDELYSAIGKLEIISVTLDQDDNAQLIFESLNSTGLALSEGDKIRNYILMGLQPDKQTYYYETYWEKIEICTGDNVSAFIRDYLSVKQQITPTIGNVYQDFKNYVERHEIHLDSLLKDMLRYARLFEKLRTSKSGLKDKRINDSLYRMSRLEITVTRPFLMEVFRLHQDGKLKEDDVLNILLVTENYLFRRNICDVPTNALNKIFLMLNREVLRFEDTTDDYVSKFIYVLLSKKDSGKFPNDDEFSQALSGKQVYKMTGKYKVYLFERFENYGTVETKDVYTQIDNNVYSIEHIMPQHLSPEWTEVLGVDYEDIHKTWLHRLANLTLSGYNPSLSNKTFKEKRDAATGGYKTSGLKMNTKIATKNQWGLSELKERNDEMINYALKIWSYPKTNFKPTEKEFDSCTLDDESVELTGREIVKYSLLNVEQPTSSWVDMFEKVLKFLHNKDKSVLSGLAYSKDESTTLTNYVSNTEKGLRNALKIDENVFIEKNNNTTLKITILRQLFSLFKVNPMALVFYLDDDEVKKTTEEGRLELRKKYWTYALPMIQEQNNFFANVTPGTSNSVFGHFGIGDFSIGCVANYDSAYVIFYMGKADTMKNKAAFDVLHGHREAVENELGVSLVWDRADNCKGSWVTYKLEGVSISKKSDWQRMAKFHAEWSGKFSMSVATRLCSSLVASRRSCTNTFASSYSVRGLYSRASYKL